MGRLKKSSCHAVCVSRLMRSGKGPEDCKIRSFHTIGLEVLSFSTVFLLSLVSIHSNTLQVIIYTPSHNIHRIECIFKKTRREGLYPFIPFDMEQKQLGDIRSIERSATFACSDFC